jgi:glycine cleavage system H protein|tara:strand:+ start:283 stop:663 length:381 start_codon:yes stop_codon:yes gene_type:complete
MTNLDNHLFTKEHEWLIVNGDIATVGITDFAQGELGDIIFIELPSAGDCFVSEEVFGTIEAVKTVADLFMPIKGDIIEVNDEIEDNPDYVNSSPYEKGWIVKIKISNTSDLANLLNHEDYKKLING